MDKELIDKAWACLPREFREEVMKEWSCIDDVDRLPHDAFLRGKCQQMRDLFGLHNLTSDAEGEEMLTVSRKEVQERYAANERLKDAFPKSDIYLASNTINIMLQDLFGSKCLPDDTNLSEKLTGSEPKFRKDEKVRIKGVAGFDVIKAIYGTGKDGYRYELVNEIAIYDESDLEPYTEPKEKNHIAQDLEMVDNIIKDGFSKERRLNIAAMIMGRIIQSGFYSLAENYREKSITEMAKLSMQITDALLAECKKGGTE